MSDGRQLPLAGQELHAFDMHVQQIGHLSGSQEIIGHAKHNKWLCPHAKRSRTAWFTRRVTSGTVTLTIFSLSVAAGSAIATPVLRGALLVVAFIREPDVL